MAMDCNFPKNISEPVTDLKEIGVIDQKVVTIQGDAGIGAMYADIFYNKRGGHIKIAQQETVNQDLQLSGKTHLST